MNREIVFVALALLFAGCSPEVDETPPGEKLNPNSVISRVLKQKSSYLYRIELDQSGILTLTITMPYENADMTLKLTNEDFDGILSTGEFTNTTVSKSLELGRYFVGLNCRCDFSPCASGGRCAYTLTSSFQ